MSILASLNILRETHRKYSGAGFFAGTPLVSLLAASNFLYSGLRFSSNYNMAATFPQR